MNYRYQLQMLRDLQISVTNVTRFANIRYKCHVICKYQLQMFRDLQISVTNVT